MKTCTLLVLLALQAADPDVVHLKDGTTRIGRIASETDTQVVLEIFIIRTGWPRPTPSPGSWPTT